jgi:hypothetical protein
MLIGLISDTHDNQTNIKKVVDIFNKKDVDMVLHGGDHIAPFTLNWYEPLDAPMKGTGGNLDAEHVMLGEKYAERGWEFDREILTVDLEGRIALTHGIREEFVVALAESGEYDVVVRGHTHERQEEMHGRTLLVNPGEACGYITGRGSVALLEMPEKTLTFMDL